MSSTRVHARSAAQAVESVGLVTVAFLWQLTGSVPGAPRWVLESTSFAHVGLVPTQSFRIGDAAAMLAIAAAGALAAAALFRRRDLAGV